MPNFNPDYILLDGYNMCHKRFNALHRFTSRDGMPTGMIFGMVNSLISFSKAFPDSKFICCFDKSAINNKREFCPEYKQNRKTPPVPFIVQLKIVKELLPCFGILCVEQAGLEADQLLATYAKKLDGKKLIVTEDKDLAQCVNDNVHLYQKPKKKWVQVDEAAVMERYGVPPNKIADWLALGGDTADNIPGIHGIGLSTARELLKTHVNAKDIFQDPTVTNNPRYKGVFTPESAKEIDNLLKLTSLPGDIDVPIPEFPQLNLDKAKFIMESLELKFVLEKVKLLYPQHTFKDIPLTEQDKISDILHIQIFTDKRPYFVQKQPEWDNVPEL